MTILCFEFKNISAIILPVLGIVIPSILFFRKITKERKDANLKIYNDNIGFSYEQCFMASDYYNKHSQTKEILINDTEECDVLKLICLVDKIIKFKKNNNSFKGFHVNRLFDKLYCMAAILNGYTDNIITGIELTFEKDKGANNFYYQYKSDILNFKKVFEEFYRKIHSLI